MKALSIQQPWAWAILRAGKDIENRTWGTKVRGRVLVHAGKRVDYDAYQWLSEGTGLVAPRNLPTGGIVGSVEIVDCVCSSTSGWFVGPYGFVLRDPQPMEFVPCVGRLGFFEVNI